MSLQHQKNTPKASPWYVSSPPESQTTAEATKQTEQLPPRYDTETVQQVIALAGQMQTHHRETLSRVELEALGAEVGVEPEFIRRALAQVEGKKAGPVQTAPTSLRQNSAVVVPVSPLTRQQWIATFLPLVVYTLFLLPEAFRWVRFPYWAPVLIYLVLPTLLAFGMGAAGKSKRLGALGGSVAGITTLLFLLVPQILAVVRHGISLSLYFPNKTILSLFTTYVIAGVVLGVSGAVARKVVPKLRKGKRLRIVID